MVYLALQEIFGSTEIFHGRTRELDVLKGVYNEIYERDMAETPFGRDQTQKTEALSLQELTALDDITQTTSSFSPESEHQSHSAARTISGASAVSARDHRRTVAFLSGISGSGKSSLVRRFVEDLQKESQIKTDDETTTTTRAPLFLAGKFNEMTGADPYSAFVEAFSELTSLLIGNDEGPQTDEYKEDLVRIQRDIEARMGPEDVAVLLKVIPALYGILSDTARSHDSSKVIKNEPVSTHTRKIHFEIGVETSTQNTWNRLKYVFQLFTKTIATSRRPVVIFLDDLQWADSGSLELLQALVTDKRIQNFMFIGAFRSDEVDSEHPLTQRINTIQKLRPVEKLNLGNFTEEELVGFLHHHMDIDSIGCKKLAKKVHSTTGGNMFYVIEVLVELNQQCALNYSQFSKGWEWDDVAGMLVLETGLVDDLDKAVKVKIKRSSKLVKEVLVTMAYARSTIDIESLFKLMKTDEPNSHPLTMNQISKALDRAVLEGFLSNSIGSHHYSFAHDKVMEASYALIPDGKEREKFRLRMGMKLYETGLKYSKAIWMLFAASEHLNSSLSFCRTHPLFLAKMNLVIGEQASNISAYDQASKCLMSGLNSIMTIPDFHPWDTEYELTLQLHRAVADVELCLGRFESGNQIGRRLLENARTLDDKLPTYESLTLALGREELHAEAVEMNREAMILLGEYPKRNRILSLAKELMVIMRYLKKTSDEDMLKLPLMMDKSKENALAFSRGLAIQAFYCDNHIEYLLATMRALQITFQYGLSGYSAMGIVGYGLVQSSILMDHAGALRGVRLARDIIRVCEAKSQEPAFRFCVAHFLEGWCDPHEKSLEAYRQGHLIGMEVGNVEDAFLNSFAAVHHARACGSPLGSIEVITDELLEQMNLYKVKSVLVLMEQAHLPVQYLTGSDQNVEPDWEQLSIEPKCNLSRSSENFRLLFWYIARVELGVYFGKFEFADRMASVLRKILPFHFAFIPLSFRLFYSGLAASGMARKMRLAGNRMKALKYRAKAWCYCKRLAFLNRSNGENSYHRELLLLADLHLSGKDNKKVSYDRAIHVCLDVGHIHDAALGSELAGEYFLATNNFKKGTVASNTRNKLIQRHFTKARDLYQCWGAYAKVNHLQKKRGDYIEGHHQMCDSSEVEIGLIVSMELGDDSSRNSSENEFSTDIDCLNEGMHNGNLLNHLAGIVPSSRVTDIFSAPEKDLQEQKKVLALKEIVENDALSIVSDFD
mmetsp:Transcript_18015/g.41529  ORF Transcript_18015/g.41529 Transcript_18015/m.41529 type:complete len:1229 (+) Transcript_18015:252-3938(+)|eukprot:CAMPEP_0197188220 /NCGR_PEP_ID=MMETSP1423-20130617/17463_1 /TAXON_ID=476441 /ORGANISM="Pseudo-nitzschia heimii, Strain UNC1101" /LENGTH=1228 /DNA_ID=CAMNT_0042640003 /DNA_START=241 /DNA_END=3927 /DNA_ORIENTATION=+